MHTTAATGRIFRSRRPIVLASASPRRRELLASVGLEFSINSCKDPEPLPEPGEAPGDYALRMAAHKTGEISVESPDCVIIGADTIVTFEDVILGKPQDADDAVRMLTELSGRTHQVITACCVYYPHLLQIEGFTVSTDVVMRASRRETLEAYVATGEPMDKAGAYAIQGIGGFLVERIDGSYSNVVGLPLSDLLDELLEREVVVPQKG